MTVVFVFDTKRVRSRVRESEGEREGEGKGKEKGINTHGFDFVPVVCGDIICWSRVMESGGKREGEGEGEEKGINTQGFDFVPVLCSDIICCRTDKEYQVIIMRQKVLLRTAVRQAHAVESVMGGVFSTVQQPPCLASGSFMPQVYHIIYFASKYKYHMGQADTAELDMNMSHLMPGIIILLYMCVSIVEHLCHL